MEGHARLARIDHQLRDRDLARPGQVRDGADTVALAQKVKDTSAFGGIELVHASQNGMNTAVSQAL